MYCVMTILERLSVRNKARKVEITTSNKVARHWSPPPSAWRMSLGKVIWPFEVMVANSRMAAMVFLLNMGLM